MKRDDGINRLNLSDLLEETSMQLRPDVPLELVVQVFQRMVNDQHPTAHGVLVNPRFLEFTTPVLF
jgi:hypothetical protein